MKLRFLALLSLIYLVACKPTLMLEKELPKKSLVMVSSGGFTGMVVKNVILRNGRVYEFKYLSQEVSEVTLKNKLKRKTARRIFKLANTIHFESLKSEQAGNMNHTFQSNRRFGKDHSFNWSQNLDSTDANKAAIIKIMRLAGIEQ